MEFVLGWDGYNNGRAGGESIFNVEIFDGSGTLKATFAHSTFFVGVEGRVRFFLNARLRPLMTLQSI